jgi:hypothetical protein
MLEGWKVRRFRKTRSRVNTEGAEKESTEDPEEDVGRLKGSKV